MFFFFYKQISFPLSFSCTCLVDTFKKTECSLICKVFTEVFFNCQNSTFYSSNLFPSKRQGNLVAVVVGSLTAWVGNIFVNFVLSGSNESSATIDVPYVFIMFKYISAPLFCNHVKFLVLSLPIFCLVCN